MEAREYTISNAYPVMKQDKVTHSSFTAHGNTLYKWRLFFKGMDGYYITNRKEDNPPTKGDTVYGSIGEDQFGNPTFKSESRPLGQLPARNAEPTTGDLEAKVDYLISLVESLTERKGDVVPTDIDDKPIDLSEIPF